MAEHSYKQDILHIENLDIRNILREVTTPFYAYSRAGITNNLNLYQESFKKINSQIHYAIKANSNLSILRLIADHGFGFDVVSMGEMHRVLAIGCDLSNTFFSGVGKTEEEIRFAISNNIQSINIESNTELNRVIKIANDLNITTNISIRVNPNIDPKTHPYVTTGLKDNKFGVSLDKSIELFKIANQSKILNIFGIAFHIGSQISTIEPFIDATKQVLKLKKDLSNINIKINNINIGGGLGINYDEDNSPKIKEYANAIEVLLGDNIDFKLHLEPGRSIVGSSGYLITKVEYIKLTTSINFAIIDAGINDLMRPALYNAKHRVLSYSSTNNNPTKYSIVGPICESSDTFATDIMLDINEGDLLAILDCGAYSSSMSSNYNSRPKIAEVLINQNSFEVIRNKENYASLYKDECQPTNFVKYNKKY